ncbi:MAG: bifunctional 2-polyprenyl-6-hydroxyphenol methylase/3-demethylubiquinol 3-O-methyltransferase UbiG [Shinella sp.]|nr:bifunctional 2-polyprenyl-6-hydroxyphenol methylase/3-demethylubiquinol 3-O-methyltransferase UbiG [Shinella sp.]
MSAYDTIDAGEVEHFSRLAHAWWDPSGDLKALHKFNPVRLRYIRDHVAAHFGRPALAPKPLSGLRLLDIGCGGGLLCEPMARLGAEVIGADASQTGIGIARAHATEAGLDIDYRVTTAEALAEAGETYDIVLAMEVVEHVADVDLFLSKCAQMVRPGGVMFIGTINRTLKAWGLAIVAAEYVLGWAPRGSHHYEKLVRPEELGRALSASGMRIFDRAGVSYNPLADRWGSSRDLSVNYMIFATRPPNN